MAKHNTIGKIGEIFALFYMMCKFYRPLKFNASIAGVQVDMILIKDGTIVFCEVKTRLGMKEDMLNMENIVSNDQIYRIQNAAMFFMNEYPEHNIRMDVIVVNSFFKLPIHFIGS
jgi:Holliday junction resolvase-like predicted endonuclease